MSERIVTAGMRIGLGLALALGGCSTNECVPEEERGPICAASEFKNWGPMEPLPPGFTPDGIASTLGTTADRVAQGKRGLAGCASGSTIEQIRSSAAIVDVRGTTGLGERCLAVQVASLKRPEEGEFYPMLNVACPAKPE